MSVIDQLADDLSNLDGILSVYTTILEGGLADDVKIKNKTIQFCNQEQPSLFSYYDQLRTEVEVLHDYMELRVRQVKATTMQMILQNSQKSYGERILEKLVDENPKYIEMQKKALKVKELCLKTRSAVDSFQQRGYALNNITKIKVAAIEEVVIYDD